MVGNWGKTQRQTICTRWGPLPVINRVLTSITRVITPVEHVQGHLKGLEPYPLSKIW